MQKIPSISIIIPSKDNTRKENISKLLEDISKQKIEACVEVCQINGICPAGRARNSGAERAKGNILVFIDDDIRITDEEAVPRLIQPLLDDEFIGTAFSSLLIPAGSSMFQRRYAREIPRCEIPPVNKLTDAGAMSTHFCAIRKKLFFKIGKFNEHLKRGEDPEFSYRLKGAGFRLVLVPGALCYHPVPQNILQLIRHHFRNGRACAFADRFYPQLNIDVNPKGIIHPAEIATKAFRIRRFIFKFLTSILTGKFLLALAKTSYIFGYLYGMIRG